MDITLILIAKCIFQSILHKSFSLNKQSCYTKNYEEEWIPEHHLKLRSNKKKSGALSSGDELSGSEVSGTEGKRRKDRK